MGRKDVNTLLLYASAHLGAYYCMEINFWYSGVYHMKQREHVVFLRNAFKGRKGP